MPGNWVIGSLFTDLISLQDDIHMLVWQYFINYNLPNRWYLTTSPETKINWKAASTHRYEVPLGGGIGKVFFAGKLPINLQLHYYTNVRKFYAGNADGTIRFQIQLLFPKF